MFFLLLSVRRQRWCNYNLLEGGHTFEAINGALLADAVENLLLRFVEADRVKGEFFNLVCNVEVQ
jgi:hypothetical protein